MSKCSGSTHGKHEHDHGPGCGHVAIKVGDDVAYAHDGHLHVTHGDHVHCRSVDFSEQNPDGCNPVETCEGHVHEPGCGHPAVPHGDHVDYLVDGRLHSTHQGHCDDHGAVEVVGKWEAAGDLSGAGFLAL